MHAIMTEMQPRKLNLKLLVTLPSYSLRERTSGAMYAGVPTVDFGLECRSED